MVIKKSTPKPKAPAKKAKPSTTKKTKKAPAKTVTKPVKKTTAAAKPKKSTPPTAPKITINNAIIQSPGQEVTFHNFDTPRHAVITKINEDLSVDLLVTVPGAPSYRAHSVHHKSQTDSLRHWY